MTVRLRTDTGVIVEASEKAAERLKTNLGWKVITDDPKPAQAVSEPVVIKRRGRPPKIKEST